MKIVWRLEKGANRNQSAPTLALPLLSIAMIVMMIFFNSNDRDDDHHYHSHWMVDLLKAMFLSKASINKEVSFRYLSMMMMRTRMMMMATNQ